MLPNMPMSNIGIINNADIDPMAICPPCQAISGHLKLSKNRRCLNISEPRRDARQQDLRRRQEDLHHQDPQA